MKALIYTRTSSCEDLAKKIIEDCKNFCLVNQIEIKNTYFDVGIRPSASKKKFKEFSKLLENLEDGDCIVCQRFEDLPKYFINDLNSTPILVATTEKNVDTIPFGNFHNKRNKVLARLVVDTCVRNSFIEELHGGKSPKTQTGDYSDVRVIFPDGEIPWTQLSRISDEEMRKLMLEIEKHVITFFSLLHEKFSKGLSEEKIGGLGRTFFSELARFGYPQNKETLEVLNNPSELNKIYNSLFEESGVSWDIPKYNRI